MLDTHSKNSGESLLSFIFNGNIMTIMMEQFTPASLAILCIAIFLDDNLPVMFFDTLEKNAKKIDLLLTQEGLARFLAGFVVGIKESMNTGKMTLSGELGEESFKFVSTSELGETGDVNLDLLAKRRK